MQQGFSVRTTRRSVDDLWLSVDNQLCDIMAANDATVVHCGTSPPRYLEQISSSSGHSWKGLREELDKHEGVHPKKTSGYTWTPRVIRRRLAGVHPKTHL